MAVGSRAVVDANGDTINTLRDRLALAERVCAAADVYFEAKPRSLEEFRARGDLGDTLAAWRKGRG